jgi:predicted DNA-binding transcriptional regulator YafY
VTTRRIEPHGLLVVTPLWYLLARDLETGQPRMFRMDRITRPRLLTEIAFTPDPQVVRSQFRDQTWWQPLAEPA